MSEPTRDDLLANWNEVDDAARAALFDAAVAAGRGLEAVAWLAERFSDIGDQCRVARVLRSSKALAPAAHGPVSTVASYYYALAGGGIETSLRTLSTALGSQARSIAVTAQPLPADQTDVPFEHLVLEDDEGEPRFLALARLVEREGVDVLVHHAWFDAGLLWDVLACRISGAAVVVNVHGVFSHFLDVTDGSCYAWNDGRLFSLVPAIAALCDGVVSQSAVNRRFFSTFNPRSFEVRHALPEPYAGDLATVAHEPGSRTVLWVGRFDIFKHPEDAVRAFALIKAACPDTRLVLCGESGYETYEQELLALADELGIAQSVELVGFVDPLPYYDAAAVLLSTTEVEGFCMVLAEACARGVPVVGYELAHLPFAQCDGIAWVDQGDERALAREAVKLLSDADLLEQRSAACLEFARRELVSDPAAGWAEVFSHIAQGSAPKAESAVSDQVVWSTLFGHSLRGQERTRETVEGLRAQLAAAEQRAVEAEQRVQEARDAAGAEAAACREEYEGSASYRLGRALTALPRAMRRKG